MNQMVNISLELLNSGMPGLTPACGKMLAESAAVCLEDRLHKTGVKLPVFGLVANDFLLEWIGVDDQQRNCYKDLQEATEHGACGIAILLVKHLTGKVVLERSRKGPGFDYWVGDENSDNEELFSGKARLEASGILSGNEGKIKSRVKQKKAQTKPSAHLAPGYVAVVEFGQPVAHVEGA